MINLIYACNITAYTTHVKKTESNRVGSALPGTYGSLRTPPLLAELRAWTLP